MDSEDSEVVEDRVVTVDTVTPRQIAWVYEDATAQRIRAACELLLGFHVDLYTRTKEELAEARQICADAWNAGRALARRRLRIDVELFLPRPSPRVILSAEEMASAMDWQVQVVVRDGSRDDEGAIAMRGEGDVSLYQPRRRSGLWSPCLHCAGHDEDETSWIHGSGLRYVLAKLRRLSPMGIEVARQLVLVLSGSGAEWIGELRRIVDLDPGGVIPGDIVEHHGSLRAGVVQPGSRVCRDGTVEHPIHVFGGGGAVSWSSARIRRLTWGDPYRGYLRRRWRADNAGDSVELQDWAKLAIGLGGNGMPRERRIPLAPGDGLAIEQARLHWWRAITDCTVRAGEHPAVSALFEPPRGA